MNTTAPLRQKRETKSETAERRTAARGQTSKTLLPGLIAERARMFELRNQANKPAPYIGKITNANTKGRYSPAVHSPSTATRTGADDGLALPSRVNDTLRYRDGREVAA